MAEAFIKPYLCFQKDFDIVNMESETKYWYEAYKNRYTGSTFIKECCQAIAFDLFCLVDGVSSENDFKVINTVFDEALQGKEFHTLWCEYLEDHKS